MTPKFEKVLYLKKDPEGKSVKKSEKAEQNKRAVPIAELAIADWFEILDQSGISENDKRSIIKAAVDNPGEFLTGKYKYFSDDVDSNTAKNEKFNTLIKNSIYNNFEAWAKRQNLDIDVSDVLRDALRRIVQAGESQPISSHSLRIVSEMAKNKEKADNIKNIKNKNY